MQQRISNYSRANENDGQITFKRSVAFCVGSSAGVEARWRKAPRCPCLALLRPRADAERHEPGALAGAETKYSGTKGGDRAGRSGASVRAEGERHEPGALAGAETKYSGTKGGDRAG